MENMGTCEPILLRGFAACMFRGVTTLAFFPNVEDVTRIPKVKQCVFITIKKSNVTTDSDNHNGNVRYHFNLVHLLRLLSISILLSLGFTK